MNALLLLTLILALTLNAPAVHGAEARSAPGNRPDNTLTA